MRRGQGFVYPRTTASVSDSSPRELTILHDEPGLVIASWEHVVIGVWWHDTTAQDLMRLADEYRRVAEGQSYLSSLTVLRVKARLNIDESVRKQGSVIATEFAHVLDGSAVIVEAKGLAATIIRSVLTSIALLSRSSNPVKPFSKIADGCEWLMGLKGAAQLDSKSAETLTHLVVELARSR